MQDFAEVDHTATQQGAHIKVKRANADSFEECAESLGRRAAGNGWSSASNQGAGVPLLMAGTSLSASGSPDTLTGLVTSPAPAAAASDSVTYGQLPRPKQHAVCATSAVYTADRTAQSNAPAESGLASQQAAAALYGCSPAPAAWLGTSVSSAVQKMLSVEDTALARPSRRQQLAVPASDAHPGACLPGNLSRMAALLQHSFATSSQTHLLLEGTDPVLPDLIPGPPL